MAIDTDIEDILHECSRSTKVCAQILFPDRFTRPFCAQHDELFDALDDPKREKLVVTAFRGFGKTSIMNLALPARQILFKLANFILPVGCSSSAAVMQSENLKDELQNNKIIAKVWGQIKPESRYDGTPFSQDMWASPWDTLVLPRGRGQQVRGSIFHNSRPDLITVDDLEDSEEVLSEDQRKKVKKWFYSDLCNCIDRSKGGWKIAVMGTILHQDSLLENLRHMPDWYHIDIQLFDDQYNSLIPDFMDTAAVKAMVETFRNAGLMDVLYREYRNLATAGEDASFQQEYFRYYEESEIAKDAQIENIVIVDPAKTVKLHSAESAVICVGMDSRNNKIYVRDLTCKKFHPDELYNCMFEMAEQWRARVVGIEVTSLHEFVTYPLTNEMVRRGLFFQLVELNARGKKENRIAALVPLYKVGLILHNKAVVGPLEAQLLSFPNSNRFDAMDALAYLIEMFSVGGRYMSNKPNDSETAEDVEREYDELKDFDPDEMRPVTGWRAA